MKSKLLLEFSRRIGLDDQSVKDFETLSRYSLKHTITVKELNAISSTFIDQLIEGFGDSLHLEIGIEDAIPEVEIDPKIESRQWRINLKKLEQRNKELQLQIILVIDKQQLLRQLDLISNREGRAILYFFRENLVRLLYASLPELEEFIFNVSFQPASIVLMEGDTFFGGALLSIGTPALMKSFNAENHTISENLREHLQRYYDSVPLNLSWTGFDIHHLTPLHFLGEWKTGEDVLINRALIYQMMQLCIIYTANWTRLQDGSLHAFYTGPHGASSLITSRDIDLEHAKGNLIRLVNWPYNGFGYDKLNIIREQISHELIADNPLENYRLFVERMPNILHESEWGFRTFINERIAATHEREETMGSIAEDIAERFDRMTRATTESLLGAFGVVVISLLGAVFSDKSGGTLITIGMLAYAVYLFIFQVCYRLPSIWSNHSLLRKDAEERWVRYKRELTEDSVESAWIPIQRRLVQFQKWFWWSITVYFIAIALLTFLAFWAPPQLAHLISSTPTPTMTATTTIRPTALPTASLLP
jgi:hypothetical protein